jgi:hypothetical protein
MAERLPKIQYDHYMMLCIDHTPKSITQQPALHTPDTSQIQTLRPPPHPTPPCHSTLQGLPHATLAQLLLLVGFEQRLSLRRLCGDLQIAASATVRTLHPRPDGQLDPAAWRVFCHAFHLLISGLRHDDPLAVRRVSAAIYHAASRVQQLTVQASHLPQHDILLLLQAAATACSDSLAHLRCSGNSLSTAAADHMLHSLPVLRRLALVLFSPASVTVRPRAWRPLLPGQLRHLELTGECEQRSQHARGTGSTIGTGARSAYLTAEELHGGKQSLPCTRRHAWHQAITAVHI